MKKILLTAAALMLVAVTAQATLYSDHVLGRSDVVAYYELNGVPTFPAVPDSSANNYDATQNDIIYRGIAGPGTADGWDGLGTSNTHYDFRGGGDISLSAAGRTATDLTTMTFSAMVRMDGNGIIYEGGNDNDNPFLIQYWDLSGTKILIRLGDNVAKGFGNNVLSDADWHHLVVTRSGTSTTDDVAVYVDGVALGVTFSGSGNPDVGTGSKIGGRLNGDQRADGGMDEIAFFNTALSATEAGELYAAAVPEPATTGMLMLGAAVTLLIRRTATR